MTAATAGAARKRGFGLIDASLAVIASSAVLVGSLITFDQVNIVRDSEDLRRSSLIVSAAVRSASRHLRVVRDLPNLPVDIPNGILPGTLDLAQIELDPDALRNLSVRAGSEIYTIEIRDVAQRPCLRAVSVHENLGRNVLSAQCFTTGGSVMMRVTYRR